MGCMDATPALVRTLAAACAASSMARAAEAMGVDKATVSRRLAALERAWPGLFERRGGRITATAAGARALAALAEIEQGEARLRAELAAGPHGSRGDVRLTLPAFLARELVLPALPGFSDAHPEIDITLLATSRMLDVARGEADVAVRNVPPGGPGVVVRRACAFSVGLYAARAYVARRGPVAPRTLDGHDFLDFEFGTISGPGLEWLPAAVKRARVVFRGDDAAILHTAARAGLGIAVLPRVLADRDRELVRVLPDELVTAVHVVVREEIRRMARVRAVAAWIASLLHAARERLAPGAS